MNAFDSSSHPRRQFLKKLGIADAGLFAGSRLTTAFAQEKPVRQPIQCRKFGRHDFAVSSLVLGGDTLRVAGDAEFFRIADVPR